MSDIVEILNIQRITHDVKLFKTNKPADYDFLPGQATEVAINQEGWKEEKRPFTFTSLPEEEHLEFVIKSYRDHDGVTKKLETLSIGDELLIDDAWGAIQYKGKGTFIAGGAGITPFISIIRSLQSKGEIKGNRLFFANKTGKDVILESYFSDLLGKDFISVLDQEVKVGHKYGRIDKNFLKENVTDFSQEFYVCGPEGMVKAISLSLEELGANPEGIVFEK
ncbi:FAD-binding oxidoreductase [Aquiflexum sp.]|uniref:FAD-binding oxidoreductase n=1 Tax=Aquiflexum sp. TaxID=1872584 RepID=UPI003594535E